MSPLDRMKGLQLRTKFVIPISLLLILCVTLITGYLIKQQADGYRRELETSGETMIHIIALNAESGVLFESKYELDQLLATSIGFDAVTYAAIYNNEGKLLSEVGDWDESTLRIKKAMETADFGQTKELDYYIENEEGEEFFELNYPVVHRKEKISRENLGISAGLNNFTTSEYITEDIGTVRLVLSLHSVNLAINEAQNTAILLTLLLLIIMIVVLNMVVRFITKPVNLLVDITDQVSRGDLTQRVAIDQQDEIGHLANTFNKMIESLQQSRNEIEEYNHTLEEKIIERSIALEDAQSQLIQSEKMSAIGQLAAGVAHELNNPLGGILGYAQFALEKMNRSVEENGPDKEMVKYIRYLIDIETQARRCKNIVQNLLRFSRASHTTEMEPTDVNIVIQDTCTFIEHQLHMNQITLKLDLVENLPLLQANASQLQQVFTNLIINAMHASPPNSQILITSQFSPEVGEFAGAVELQFIDQGCGIPDELKNKIFEPFFTTKEVGKGTGLGLSVSYGIIKEHGGEVRIESTVGEGTTFIIIFPVQKAIAETDKTTKRLSTP